MMALIEGVASISKICNDFGWINNYGYSHLYYYGPESYFDDTEILKTRPWYYSRFKVHSPRCRWMRRCLICLGVTLPIEKDPDERIMPHDWKPAKGHRLLENYNGDEPILDHELVCEAGCGAVWDPVPDGKDKLL